MIVNKAYKNWPLKIWGYKFPIYIILLSFNEFDTILGVDWVTIHDVVVNCKKKQIVLKCPCGDLISVEIDRSDCATSIVSALTA